MTENIYAVGLRGGIGAVEATGYAYEFIVDRIQSYQIALNPAWYRHWNHTVRDFSVGYTTDGQAQVYFEYEDYDGDLMSGTLPPGLDIWSMSDEEFKARCAEWKAEAEAEQKKREEEQRAEEAKRKADALARAEKAKQKERDKIFREECEKRGIKLT